VERSLREYAAGGASLAHVDPALMAEQGWQVGDLLRLSTFRRDILARPARPAAPRGRTW
jgi:hypothetical protein